MRFRELPGQELPQGPSWNQGWRLAVRYGAAVVLIGMLVVMAIAGG